MGVSVAALAGMVVSVFGMTTRADDLTTGLGATSSFGVSGWAAAGSGLAAAIERVAVGAVAAVVDASSDAVCNCAAGLWIGVPSGRRETVRTGLGSGNIGATAACGSAGATIGGSWLAATGEVWPAATGEAWLAATGEAWLAATGEASAV